MSIFKDGYEIELVPEGRDAWLWFGDDMVASWHADIIPVCRIWRTVLYYAWTP